MSLQLKTRPQPKLKPVKQNPNLDLIIIGGGPAGLTSAIYAMRARLKVLLVEKMILGGMASTTYFIENYPGFPDGVSGMELSNRLQDQAKKLGLDVTWGQAIKIIKQKQNFEVQVDERKLNCKAVIIASGTEAEKLNVPREEEFRGRGVSYCATCDGAFYKDKNIMVVGGGNAAIEEALFLTRYASKVSIVHRRDQLRADKILAEKAMANPKIYFFWHSVVAEIKGDKKVNSVILKDLKEKKPLNLAIDGVFVYIGSKPNNGPVKDLVKLDKNGFIITDKEMKTACNGVYAAGDIRSKKLRQIVTAAADGAIAAESAREYVEEC